MSKLKILIDGVVFENDSQIGIWRIFYEVMSRTSSDVDYVLLLSQKALQPIPARVQVRKRPSRYDPDSRRRYYRRIIDWPHLHASLTADPDAIWHSTFYTADPRPSGRSIVSVYDMAAERCYSIGPYVAQRNYKRRAINSASAALAISHATARELHQFYPCTEGKVCIAPLGHEHISAYAKDSLRGGTARQQATLPASKFCLYVGGRYAYKNFCRLAEAVGHESWPQDVLLVVAGAAFDDAELAFARATNSAPKIHYAGKPSDSQLMELYRSAICLVFPSLIEGFGIPVLESQACETLPVLSDINVFREIGGDAAIYFDPHSARAIAEAVRSAADSAIRENILRKCQANLQRYSWDITAAKTIEAYEMALRSPGK